MRARHRTAEPSLGVPRADTAPPPIACAIPRPYDARRGERAPTPDIRRCGGAGTGPESSVHPTRRRTAMTQNSEHHYQKATVIGGGVIGASWTALFLARGLDVTVCDPAPGIELRIRTELAAIAPNLAQLGLPIVSSPSMPLLFDSDIATAVAAPTSCRRTDPSGLRSSSRCGRRWNRVRLRMRSSRRRPPASRRRRWPRG